MSMSRMPEAASFIGKLVRDGEADAAFVNPAGGYAFANRAGLKVIDVPFLPMVWFTTVSSGAPFRRESIRISSTRCCDGVSAKASPISKPIAPSRIKIIKEKYKAEGELDDETATHLVRTI